MDSGPATRSTARPHWTAVLATVFVAAILLLANIDGYHNQLFGERDLAGEPPLINWAHGWPWTFVVRASFFSPTAIYTAPDFSGSPGITSRWPFDDAQVFAFWVRPLVLDSICFVVSVLGTAYATQRIARWWNPQNSYGLRTMFIATAVVAVALCFGPALFANDRRFALNYVVLFVAGVAAALTLFSLTDFALRIVRRLRANIPAPPA
jgi:hypothetical protein